MLTLPSSSCSIPFTSWNRQFTTWKSLKLYHLAARLQRALRESWRQYVALPSVDLALVWIWPCEPSLFLHWLVLWPLQYVLAQPSHSKATNTNYPWWKESGSCPVVHVLHECVASSLINKGIKLFTCAGVSFQEAKTLMTVMLFSALGLNHEPCCSGFWPVCRYNNGANNVSALIAMMITLLCIALGYITLLRWEVHKLRGEKN